MRRIAHIALFLSLPLPLAAAEIAVPAGAGADVTLYGADRALVRERRTFKLPTAEARLAFAGVSRHLQPETAAIAIIPATDLTAGDVRVLDQTFAFNVISPESLVEHSIGQEVSVVTTNPATGREVSERARIISAENGVVLDIAGKIHTAVPGRLVFDSLPAGLRPTPTLLMNVTGPVGKDIGAELTYLTAGLGWHADYVARYDSEANRLDLTAWASLTNTTGVDYRDAKIKLVAGDQNRVVPSPQPRTMRAAAAPMAAAQATPLADGVTTPSIDGAHIYALARPTTLATGETKQVILLRAVSIPVKREYAVRGQPWFFTSPMPGQVQEGRAEIEVALKNEAVVLSRPKGKSGKAEKPEADEAIGGLGIPLPAGIVRAYGEDSDGAAQFLGEDRIDHVADGGEVKLHLGRDVDLSVKREQTSFVRASDALALSVWRITLRNAKSKPATIRLIEPVAGNWDVTRESQAHIRNAAGLPEWDVVVPPKGEVVLEYNIKSPLQGP